MDLIMMYPLQSIALHVLCPNALFKLLYTLDKVDWLEQTLIARVNLTGNYPQTRTPEGVNVYSMAYLPFKKNVFISVEVERILQR